MDIKDGEGEEQKISKVSEVATTRTTKAVMNSDEVEMNTKVIKRGSHS